jgi:hypothetical protein
MSVRKAAGLHLTKTAELPVKCSKVLRGSFFIGYEIREETNIIADKSDRDECRCRKPVFLFAGMDRGGVFQSVIKGSFQSGGKGKE